MITQGIKRVRNFSCITSWIRAGYGTSKAWSLIFLPTTHQPPLSQKPNRISKLQLLVLFVTISKIIHWQDLIHCLCKWARHFKILAWRTWIFIKENPPPSEGERGLIPAHSVALFPSTDPPCMEMSDAAATLLPCSHFWRLLLMPSVHYDTSETVGGGEISQQPRGRGGEEEGKAVE